MKQEKQDDKVIAIDFDGTITKDSPFPKTGEVRQEIIPFIELFRQKGYKIVLYTCRTGKYLLEAVDILKETNLYNLFDWDYINNPENYKHDKLVYDFLIDDKCIPLSLNSMDWNWLMDAIVATIDEHRKLYI